MEWMGVFALLCDTRWLTALVREGLVEVGRMWVYNKWFEV
jgi:hypothetical protein